MLTRVDRVQAVVADRAPAIDAWRNLLGAEVLRDDRLHVLAARRTVLRVGSSCVELLEPDGTGAVSGFLAATGGGLFAVGFATCEPARSERHFAAQGVAVATEGEQLFLAPEALRIPGLRVVISPDTTIPPTGLLRHLYEVTVLVPDFASVVDRAAAVFGLDTAHFVPISSSEFGYSGTLTLFRPDALDRMEIITPSDATKTMGRFFAKRGPSLYMCYGESDDLALLRRRLEQYAPRFWSGMADDNVFIHPGALSGMMLGVSRSSFAWTWSGHPEWVVPRRTS